MFDIGWQELFIVAVLALIVVGPKDLPKTIKAVMGWVRKARSMAREFQSGVDDMVREAELDDVKKQLTDGSSGLKKELEQSIGSDISKDLDLSDDVVEKINSNVDDELDLDDIFEPEDAPSPKSSEPAEPATPADKDAQAEVAEAAVDETQAADDDDDVMPIPSTNKADQTS